MPLKLMSDSAMRRKDEDEAKRKAVGGYKDGGMVKKPAKPMKGKGYANGGMVKVKGKNC